MSSAILFTLLFSPVTFAAGGGRLTSQPITYSAGVNASVKTDVTVRNTIKSGRYEHTGFGAAESTVDTTPDGTLIYAPAFSGNKTGYATSKDYGKTWSMVIPSPNQPSRNRRLTIHDGRYFYWSSSMPGLHMSYSDDEGKTWVNSATHLQPLVQDWVKIVGGKPVSSRLENRASKILYMSGPSLISVPIVPGLGPINQIIMKSVDRGTTWKTTRGNPTLVATKSGGSCSSPALTKKERDEEYIIWGDGLVRPNGTVMFGLRRCRAVSVAVSDDEGESWRFSDIPGSSMVPYSKGLLTYVVLPLPPRRKLC